MDLITLQDNEAAFDRYKIRPRILVNVENVDTSGKIFGCKTAIPLGFSPTAMQRLAHPDGELASSRVAAQYGLCMCLSSYATESIEDVGAQGQGNPYVLQLSMLRDRWTTTQMLQRAEGKIAFVFFQGRKPRAVRSILKQLTWSQLKAAGYKAVFLTVDGVLLGRRINEYRNNFKLPEDMTWPNLLSTGKDELSGAEEYSGTRKTDYDPSICWDTTIPWLRSQTKMELWLKGVYTAEDVNLAIKHGLDGIVVSNHGGRQLDGVPATLDTLRECAVAAAGRIPITVDGGIRRGTDIFKALALGASHVFVGRIPIWGMAVGSRPGDIRNMMYNY
ncbi:hypothetical protein QQS21_003161 [Conoideocrella luteorostrata]|uniref:FMN hydroxy acid dehydrogenase domain-containing protein n=1 Tax=Conoideocrella luteorostrata TaxID=1105319 RepID=A0AAJ0FWN3_9HYPO|nr:hypothetical protein QQS21_003161 [Conoideocrella luteorostrata]